MRFATLILVSSFIIKSVAVPFISNIENVKNQCSLSCIDNKKFDYEIGKAYVYEYVAETETKLQNKGNELSSLKIRTKAEIVPISTCDFVLRLSGVSLETASVAKSGSFNGDEFRVPLEKYSLRFGFRDGRIESICPNENDPIWVLNIKKGILSVFQNSMTDFEKDEIVDEVDVTGKCLTHYTVAAGTWLSDTTIHKTKNLMGCTNRTDRYTSLQFNSYNPKILSRTTSLVQSTHTCEQIMKNGYLKQAVCKEVHAFQPFSNEKSGAVSTNIQTLTFVNKEELKLTPIDFVSRRTNLLFEHKFRDSSGGAERLLAENSLRTLCAAAKDDIRPEIPRLFSDLVRRLQELNYENLFNIYKNVDTICNGNSKARKFLYDAIPLTGSDAGVTLMRDFILRKEISKAEADSWLLMIGFLPRPTKAIISSLMPLLDNPEEHSKGLLGISALTHSYCKSNSDCGRVPEVQQLVKKLADNLKENCDAKNDIEKDTMVLTLKALGNIGYIQDVLPVLEKCYRASSENLIEIRTAALDALRRLPCDYNRDSIHNVFFNYEEDSEVRIAAYLALMKCPTHQLLVKVREHLDNEAVNQVGSFVWTHLTSLQESSDPNKQDLKNILSNKKLQKKFSTDVRKFSRYYEGSIFMDSLKVGAVADGNVIFSPKSYIPRSASLGLIVDVFGESINLFEIGGRVEGFEFIFESFFGPNGYFPDDAILKMLTTAREQKSYDEKKLNEIEKIFNVKHYSENDPKGSLFMRIFGNDVSLLQFRGIEQLLHRSTTGFNILQELIQLTQKNNEYTKSITFIDSSFILPTSVGLPLNLTINGTATVNLRVGGKLDLSQIRSKTLQFKADVQPSAAVEISSSMIHDAFVTRSGLKMISTLHTSTYGNVEVMVQKGEVVQAKINSPRDKIEVFDIRSEVYLVEGHEEHKHPSLVPENIHRKRCTGQGLSKVLGLEICGEVEYPLIADVKSGPSLLLAGPLAAKVYLLKTDKELTTYNLEYRWDKQPIGGKFGSLNKFIRVGRFSVNTPKSSINRELLAEYIYNEDHRTIDINFVTPIKKLSYSGKLVNDRNLKLIDTVLKVDDEERVSLHSELRIDETDDSYRITPNVNFHLNGKPVIDLKGYALRQDGKKYSAEFTIDHISSQPIVISGFLTKNVIIGQCRYDTEITINSQPVYINAKWLVQTGDATMSTKGTFDYRWLQGERQFITLYAKSNRSQNIQMNKLNVEAGFQWSANPNASLELLLENMLLENHTETSFTLSKGPLKDKFLNVQYRHECQGSLTEHKVKSSLKIACLPTNTDTTFEFNHELTKKAIDTKLTMKSGSDDEVAVVLAASKNANKHELIRGLAKIIWSKHVMEINGNVLQPKPGDYMATVQALWDPNAEAKAVLTLRNYEAQSYSWGHKLKAEVTMPGQHSVILTGDVLLNNVERRILGEVQFDNLNYKTFVEYYRPTIENVRVHVGATSPTNKYLAKAEYHNSVTEKKATADLQLGHHRHIVADVDVKRGKRHVDVSLTSNFDFDHHPDRNYSMHLAHARKNSSNSQGSLTVRLPSSYDIGFGWNVSIDGSKQRDPYVLSGHCDAWWGEHRITTDINLNATLRPSTRNISAVIKIKSTFNRMGHLIFVCNHVDDGIRWNNTLKVFLDNNAISALHSEGRLISEGGRKGLEVDVKVEPYFGFESPIIINAVFNKTDRESLMNFRIHWAHEKKFDLTLSEIDNDKPEELNRIVNFNLTSAYTLLKHLFASTRVVHGKKTVIQSSLEWNDQRFNVDYESKVRRQRSRINSYYHIRLATPFERFENLTLNLKFGMDSSSTSSAIDFEWDVQKRASLEITKRTFGSQNDFILGLQCTTPFDGARNVTFLFDINRDVDEVHCRVLASLEETHPLSARFDLETRSPKDIYCGVEIDEPYGLFNHFDGKIRYFVTESQFLTEVRGSLKNDSIEICLNASSMNSRVNASKAYTGLISVSTPHSLLGKFKLALEHFHQPYLWKTTVKAEVLPSGDNYRVSLAYNVTQNTLTGSFELITPFPGMQTVEFILAYDRDLSEKSGSLTVNWKGAFINRFQSNFRYGKNRLVLESDLTVPTTLGFAFLKLNLNNTEPLKVGKFIIGLDDIIIQLYGEGKMIRNQGYLNLTLSTPYDGYEALNVVTAVNLKKSEKHVSLTSNSAQGEIKIKAFHKAASQSMDSGITFTSFISGFEKLYLGSHFESNKTGESKAQIKVEKGEFKAYLNVDYNVNPSTRYINIAFNSPIHEIKSLKFSGKYELSDAMELEATFIHNSKPVVDFKAKVTGDNRKAQVNVMLTTSLKQLESFTFDGRYELRSPKKYGEVTAKINNEKLNMKCELEHSRLKSEVVASLTSPFEGLENLLFLAGARKDGDNLRAAVNARRNSHFLEATMQSFWTNMKKKFTIELKTSLPGYELAGISLEDDNSLPKRHSKMLLYQEKNKISIEGDFVVTADYFQTVITSTIPGYDTSILSVERDRTKPKSLHLISFQNGPNKYVATWEFAHSPTYLEYKLQWKTPFEESMAYLNYNLNGANAVTFDMKLIKHKTMMEVSGRFWKLPGKPKADGSVVFNTNYLKMIAASVSGRCDLTGDTKDLIFQFDINGKKAEMMASAKTVSSIWTVIVNGSSSFPDWRTFGLSGTVDGRKSEKVVKMTLTRNSKNVQVTGSMFYHPQSTKAQLTLSTPLPGYEFLLANVVADFSKPQKRVNVVIKQNTNTLLNVVTNHYIADGKMTTDAKVQSQIPGIPNMEIDVTMDSTNKQKLFLKFKVNDQIAHLDLKGNANSTNGNFMITVSGNLIRPLFSTNDGILEVRYNTMKPFIYALVTSNGFQVYEISLDVPKRREEPHTVNHSSDKEKGIQTTHDKASVEVVFKVRVSGQDLVSMSSKILRRSADFKIASDVLGKDLLFSVNYDFGEQKKIASLKYKEGSSIFELEGHFMIEPLTENDRSVYDAGISLKTPWKRLENAELSLGVEKTDKFFKLNSIIKATPLLGKVAELLVDVNYSTGFEIGLSSSFEGYESVRFYAVHSVEDTRHKIDVAFDWSTQKVALSLEKSPGKIDIVFISPFSGFERLGAVFLYGTEPLKASLILSISPSRKIEMTAQVHLGHHKGTWSAFFLPLDTHKPYVLEGSYDFTLNQIARLYAEGQGKKFEAAVKLTGDMASSRQLNVEIITPMTSFYRFSLKAEYSSSNNATAASLRIQANDMTYHATGNVRRHEDGFEFEMKANSPVDGYQFLTINGQGNVTGSRRFMDLFFKMDEQSVVVFRGEVTQRLPYEFTSTVRLVTPLQGITNIGWDASYRLENTVIEASTALLWQANTIQLLSRLSPDEMKFTMTTPFSYLNNVRYDGKLIVNELNFLMSSTLKVNDNQYTLKVVMDHELRSYFNATVELWTPFETFHHLDASLKVNYKSDEPFTASFTIETPFDGFPKAEVLLVIDNTVSRNVKTHLQVNLAGLQYSVEGMAYDDGAGNCNWTTIVKTPHRGYEVITASRHTFYKDSAERGEELLIQTPTAKHSMRWSFVLKPENLGFEIFCDSPLLPNSPMSIQVLYIIQDNQVSLRVATRAGGCRRTLTWIQTPDVAGVYKGMMSYERVAFDEDTWSLEYLLDSTSSASARFTAVINLIHQINSSKYNISSLSIIFGNRAPNFNVNFLITENNNDHKFNFGYKIDESTFDCSLQIISTLLTHKSLLLTGHVNPREVNVVLTLGNIQNVFNMNYKTSIKESDGAIKIKAPIWNIDTTLKGRFQMNAYQLKGEISLQDQKYTHSLSILFQHSAEEWFVRLNLRTPLYDFGSLVVESRTNCECEEEGKQKINVVTKVFFQRQVHRVTLSLVKDAATMEGLLKVESPALQSPKGLVVHARILKVTANERNGLITITHGDHEHKAELNVLCDPSKVYSAEAKVDTPYWGINALSVKSQLLTDVHGNSIDTSLIVNFSEATHTVTCKLDRDPSMKQIYVYIYTPYLGFEPYSLSAKVIHETKGIEVSASLQLAEVNHTLDFFVTKKNKGFSIQATVNTPLLDSDEVTFIVNVIRLDSTGLEAAFELNWRSVVHTMNFTAWLESGLAFFNATVKTPLFNVGRVMASGRIFTTKHNQLNFEMTAKTSEKEYNIRGYVGLTTTGIIGDIQINDLAGLGPFEFHVDVTKASMEGVEAICTIKTSNNHHNFRGHLRRNTGFLDFHLKVNSSALSFQDFAVTGNVTFQFPLYVECNFVVETSGQLFKILSNYHSNNADGVEGDLTVVTPFHSLPFLRINGKLSRNPRLKGINGGLEMYMADESFPQVAASVKLEEDDHNHSLGIVRLQIPILGYEDVTVHLGTKVLKDSSRYHILKYKANDYAYGYEVLLLKKYNARKVNSKVFIGQRTYAMQAALERNLYHYNVDFILETPIHRLSYIKYEAQYEWRQPNQRVLQTSLSVNDLKVLVRGEWNYSSLYNFDCLATIDTSLQNFEKINIKLQQHYDDHQLRFLLEQSFDDKESTFALLMDFEQKGSNGSGLIQLTTPMNALQTADAYYKYDHFGNHINGDVGLNHNGRQILEMKATAKDDIKVLEILNPIRPITIQYSFVNRDGILHVSGEYCWDSSRRFESSIGFDATITVTKYGRQVIIRSIHPKKPLTMSFQLETTPTLFVQTGELSWGNGDSSITSYEIRMLKDTMSNGKRTYDTTIRVVLPFRSLELTTRCECSGGSHYSSTAFKWDAQKDPDKVVILKTQDEDHSTSTRLDRRAEISIVYPKLNQSFVVRNEITADRYEHNFVHGRLDIEHGSTAAERFTIEGKLNRLPHDVGYYIELKAAHPISKVDVTLTSDVTSTNENAAGGIHLTYLTAGGQYKNLKLRNQLHKFENKLQTMMIFDDSRLNLTGQMQYLPSGYLLFLESKVNDNNPVTAIFRLNRGNGTMTGFSADYNQGNRVVKIRGGMQDPQTIFADAYHQDDHNAINDVTLLLNLNQSRELITQLNWRPDVLKELEDSVVRSLTDTCKEIRKYFKEFVITTSNELHRNYEDIGVSLGRFWTLVGDDVANELRILDHDSHQVQQALHDLYINNDFYLRSIYDSTIGSETAKSLWNVMAFNGRLLLDIIESVKDSLRLAVTHIKGACKNLCNTFDNIMSGRIQDIPYVILHFAEQVNEFGIQTVHDATLYGLKFLKDILSLWVPSLNEFTTPEWIRRVSNNVKEELQKYIEKFFASTYYRKLVENFNDLVSTLKRIYHHQYIQCLKQVLSPLADKFASLTNKLAAHPYVNVIKKCVDYSYNLGVWTYDFFKIEERLKDFVSAVVARVEDIVLSVVEDIVLPEINFPILKQDVFFEPENGKLKIIQALPVTWNSFTELPTIYGTPAFNQMMDFKDSLIRLPKTSLNKLFQATASEFSWNHLVPRFRSRALLVGNQHYVTFDGRAYDFVGECTYLLAHDFVDNNFTVIVKYKRESDEVITKYFTVVIDGESFDAHDNLAVTINSTHQNLPLTLGQTRISRTQNSLKVSNDAKQIWVLYDKQADVFMLEIGGFYHGKTAGLFGNFDHEPFNDFLKSNNEESLKIEEFVASWEIGSQPCLNKNYAYRANINSYQIQKTCNDIFDKYSSLTSCLRKLDPTPYKSMCLSDVTIGKTPCAAVSAYVMMCNVNGIRASTPHSCLDCVIGSTKLQQGKSLKLEGSAVPQSVDVVFILDNTWQCSTTFPNIRNVLSTVSKSIEGALKSASLDNNKYAVVGFGIGAPYSPEVISVNGSIFGNRQTVDVALNHTHFAGGHHHHFSQLIDVATELRFRDGVGKVFVVVPCGEPSDVDEEYSELVDKLSEMDIILHVISLHKPTLSDTAKVQPDDIIGFDNEYAYTTKSSQHGSLLGDKDVRHQITVHSNSLASLALNTNGSVFMESKINNRQPSVSKLATEVFSRRIVANASPSMCQKCMCSTALDGSPATVCSKCH